MWKRPARTHIHSRIVVKPGGVSHRTEFKTARRAPQETGDRLAAAVAELAADAECRSQAPTARHVQRVPLVRVCGELESAEGIVLARAHESVRHPAAKSIRAAPLDHEVGATREPGQRILEWVGHDAHLAGRG